MTNQALIARFRMARKDPSFAVLEGFHSLKHALRFKAEVEVVVVADARPATELATDLAPDVQKAIAAATEVGPEVFSQLAPTSHPTGVIAIAKRPLISLETLFSQPPIAPIVVLDHPQRLSNIGASVRVAAAAGAAALIVVGDRDPWSPEAIRGGAGLQFALPVLQTQELPPTNRPIIAIDPEGELAPKNDIPPGVILAFGSERSGIEPALLARATQRLRIPMRPGVSSLNLATSVAAVLYGFDLGNTLQ